MKNHEAPGGKEESNSGSGFDSLKNVKFAGEETTLNEFERQAAINALQARKNAEEAAEAAEQAKEKTEIESSSYVDSHTGEEITDRREPSKADIKNYSEAREAAKKASEKAEDLLSPEGQAQEAKRLEEEHKKAEEDANNLLVGLMNTPNANGLLEDYDKRIASAEDGPYKERLRSERENLKQAIIDKGREIREKEPRTNEEQGRDRGIRGLSAKKEAKLEQAEKREERLEDRKERQKKLDMERYNQLMEQAEKEGRAKNDRLGLVPKICIETLERRLEETKKGTGEAAKLSQTIELIRSNDRDYRGELINQGEYLVEFAKKFYALQEKMRLNKDKKQERKNKKALKRALGVKKLPETPFDKKFIKKVVLGDLEKASQNVFAYDEDGELTGSWAYGSGDFSRHL